MADANLLPPPLPARIARPAIPPMMIRWLLVVALLLLAVFVGRWDWMTDYWPRLIHGVGVTLLLLVGSCVLGFSLALPLGVAQTIGPWFLAWPARIFCTFIRGTPLLLQLWILYYGLGAVFAQFPEIRSSFMWPVLRTAWPYGLLALVMSFAGYAGEVMRGAFAGVPKGELEAATAFGMNRSTAFFRIWLPRAVQRALPTLIGETILQLKSTPLVATVTVIDVFAVIAKIRQDTYLTYEPLILLATIYIVLTVTLTRILRVFESKAIRR